MPQQIALMRQQQIVMGQVSGHDLQQMQQLSPKLSGDKDYNDMNKGHRRERTRSKSRDRRSKSSRSGGGSSSSRRERSRSRDRRRRDRSRGRDRSRDRHHGSDRSSLSRSSGGIRSHRSKSPAKVPGVGGDLPIRPWACQYDNQQPNSQATGVEDNSIHPPSVTTENRTSMNAGTGLGGGGIPQKIGSMFSDFRTPPQPPIIPPIPYQQQQQLSTGMEEPSRQLQPYAADNGFQGNVCDNDNGHFDEDEQYSTSNSGGGGGGGGFQRKYNENAVPPRRGGGQGFNDQQPNVSQGFGGGGAGHPNARGPRFHKPPMQQNRGNNQRPYDTFSGVGPRFGQQQQQPKFGQPPATHNESIRPSRFSGGQGSNPEGGGRPSRFNSEGPVRDDYDDPKRLQRFNDRYRYDVRNAQAPRSDGLCVEVNNMSNHFSYGDIRKVFEGIHIDGSAIKIQKHRQGVAFVRFDSNHNKNLAMKCNGSMYKGNHIVVKHLDDDAYQKENTDDRPYPAGRPTEKAAAATVVDHVDLVDDDDDDDNEDNNLVLCEKNKDDDGGGDGDQSSENTQKQQQQQPSSEPKTKYLKLKQLPITVTEADVLSVIDEGVRRVTFYPDGEFRGALLEFTNVDSAEAAFKRDCVLLGSTPVSVLRCSNKEFYQIKRQTSSKRSLSDGGGNHSSSRHHHSNSHHHHHHAVTSPPAMPLLPETAIRSNCLYVYGLPTTVTNTDITQFFADVSVLPDKIHIMLSKLGRPTGESYCEFGSVAQAHAASAKDQCYMGLNLVYVEPINRADMIQAITKPMQQHQQQPDMSWPGMRANGPRHHNNMMAPPSSQGPPAYGGHHNNYGGGRPHHYMNNGGGGRGGVGGGYTPRMRAPGPGPNTGPDGFGQPGCVVALDNVPYRADVQEIVDFFDGFDLNSQNVIRRFNDYGKPTGEARVNLRNPQEAMRAVRMLQNKSIHNRPVRLTLL